MKSYQTKQRKILENILIGASRPLLVSEIKSSLDKRGLKMNESTIYRNVEFFVKNKQVKKILLLERKARYEWHKRHHHHFSCRVCNTIYEIEECDLREFENEISLKLGHMVHGHNLELTGVCKKCSSSRTSVS